MNTPTKTQAALLRDLRENGEQVMPQGNTTRACESRGWIVGRKLKPREFYSDYVFAITGGGLGALMIAPH